jgi:hypothetical protein
MSKKVSSNSNYTSGLGSKPSDNVFPRPLSKTSDGLLSHFSKPSEPIGHRVESKPSEPLSNFTQPKLSDMALLSSNKMLTSKPSGEYKS